LDMIYLIFWKKFKYEFISIDKIQAILQRIKEMSNSHIIYPGLDFKNSVKPISIHDIPGISKFVLLKYSVHFPLSSIRSIRKWELLIKIFYHYDIIISLVEAGWTEDMCNK